MKVYEHAFRNRAESGHVARRSGRVRLHVYDYDTITGRHYSTAQYLTRWEAVKLALALLLKAGSL